MSTVLMNHPGAFPLLVDLRAQGFTFNVAEGEQLFVTPRPRLTEEQVEAIRANKAALIELIVSEAEMKAASELKHEPEPEVELEPVEPDSDDDLEPPTPRRPYWQTAEGMALEPYALDRLCGAIGGGLVDFHEMLSRDIEQQVGEPIRELLRSLNEDMAYHGDGIEAALKGLSERHSERLADSLRSNFERAAIGLGSTIEEGAEEIAATIGEVVRDQCEKLRGEIREGFAELNLMIGDGFASVVAAIREQKPPAPIADGLVAGLREMTPPPQPRPKGRKGGES